MPYLRLYTFTDLANVRDADFCGLAMGQLPRKLDGVANPWVVGLLFRQRDAALKIAKDIYSSFAAGEDLGDELKLMFNDRDDGAYEFSCYYLPSEAKGTLSKTLVLKQSPPERGPDLAYQTFRTSWKRGSSFLLAVGHYDETTGGLELFNDQMIKKVDLHFNEG
jgi:hypothetical protein